MRAVASVVDAAPRMRLQSISASTLKRLGTGLIALTVTVIALTLWIFRSEALNEAQRDASGLATALAEQTTRTVHAADLVIGTLHERVVNIGIDTPQSFATLLPAREIHDLLAQKLLLLPQADALMLVGADGQIVNSTHSWPLTPVSVQDRDYYQHFLSTNDAGPFIGASVKSRVTDADTIYVVRRIDAPDGRMVGLIGAALRTKYFNDLYGAIVRADGRSVTLARRDGKVIATQPPVAGGSEPANVATPAWRDMVARGGGQYRAPAGQGDTARTVAVRPLAEYPLVVNVAIDESALLERWWHHAWAVALGLIGIALYAMALLRALARKSRELELTLNHMTQGILMVAPDRKVPVINQRAIELLDLPKSIASRPTTFDEILNFQHNCQEFGKGGVAVEPVVWDSIQQGGAFTHVPVYERVRPNGTALEIRTLPLPDGGLVRTFTDITERRRAAGEVRAMALRDELTGLANRARLHEHLEDSLRRLQRTGEGFCVISLDLDRLKAINDTLGHAIGDMLLQQVAARLLVSVEKDDLVARIGTDTFVIVHAGVDHPLNAIPLIHTLLNTVGAAYTVNGQRLVVATSIGIAAAPNDGDTAERLVKNADLALHRAKTDGRGVYRFFEPEMQVAADAKARMATEMRDALASEQFEVHYLPWINCETGRVAGCEALVRWRHPSLGLIGPSEFIPVAEECGLIGAVGDWVLRRATVEACQWPDNVRLAVNVSAAQFLGNDLSGSVTQALSSSGFPANRLELEVTESLLLFERGDQRAMLQQLNRQGVHMALDDFGTGYSSFRYLDVFPFNRIKIDRSFVANITKRPHCAAIVTAAIELGRSLEMRTTAEGVESQDQLAFLKQRGCEDVQGFLFGRPCRAPELLDRLTRPITLISAA